MPPHSSAIGSAYVSLSVACGGAQDWVDLKDLGMQAAQVRTAALTALRTFGMDA